MRQANFYQWWDKHFFFLGSLTTMCGKAELTEQFKSRLGRCWLTSEEVLKACHEVSVVIATILASRRVSNSNFFEYNREWWDGTMFLAPQHPLPSAT